VSAADRLRAYARVAIRVGLNLQPGQRLLIVGAPMLGGVSLEVAPFIREITASAYDAGASLVEVLWGDPDVLLTRFRRAPRSSFGEFSNWLTDVVCSHAEHGGALLLVRSFSPSLLMGEDQALVGQLQQAMWRNIRRLNDLTMRGRAHCCVIAAPYSDWAAQVFPHLPAREQLDRLWDAVARVCRLDEDDPVERWRTHVDALTRRCERLDRKAYSGLRFRGPGTDLQVGLPSGHHWRGASSISPVGIPFTLNLPTEEVFTLPHRDRVEGIVRATRPIVYGGVLVEGATLTFVGGALARAHADRGDEVLQRVLQTDEGARRLGEVALVPRGSASADGDLLFYDTLFDENAASHIALGAAYPTTLEGGDVMSDDAFEQAGGNRSAVHIDISIGSDSVEIDALTTSGTAEALIRSGTWLEA
jgi:aminopeptidase